MSVENTGPNWKLTGNVRCRAGWNRQLVLQVEVRNGPFAEWRDARMQDFPVEMGVSNQIEGGIK